MERTLDPTARSRLVSGPWVPKTYNVPELMELLRIDETQAQLIIFNCNAGDPGDEPWADWCNHHDLVLYLKDLITPSEVPESLDDLSVHGKWLFNQGWRIDGTRTYFRWVDPQYPAGRIRLNAALSIALGRLRPKPKKNLDPDIIEVEVLGVSR